MITGCLNLECISDSELEAVIVYHESDEYRRIARLVISARELRKSGQIAKASKEEARVDYIYRFLPKALRW